MPADASSTASTTTDDILAVYDDAAGLRCAKHKASAMSLSVTLYGSRLKDALSDMC